MNTFNECSNFTSAASCAGNFWQQFYLIIQNILDTMHGQAWNTPTNRCYRVDSLIVSFPRGFSREDITFQCTVTPPPPFCILCWIPSKSTNHSISKERFHSYYVQGIRIHLLQLSATRIFTWVSIISPIIRRRIVALIHLNRFRYIKMSYCYFMFLCTN